MMAKRRQKKFEAIFHDDDADFVIRRYQASGIKGEADFLRQVVLLSGLPKLATLEEISRLAMGTNRIASLVHEGCGDAELAKLVKRQNSLVKDLQKRIREAAPR